MNFLLRELKNTGNVIYIDNILVFTKTIEEYHDVVNWVLAILEKNKLTLQSKKHLFHQTKIDYLDIIISKNSVEIDPEKVKKVTKWPKLKDK